LVRSGTGGIVSDEALVQQWPKKEYPKLKAMAQKEEAELVSATRLTYVPMPTMPPLAGRCRREAAS
jgi:hypothetical protein